MAHGVRRRSIFAAGLGITTIAQQPAASLDNAAGLSAGLADAVRLTYGKDAFLRPDAVSLVQRPLYGIESDDVMYPEWCLGRWKVRSTLKQVEAPAGSNFFSVGRNGTESLDAARREIGQVLEYDCRWVRRPDGKVVVDRGYNTESITRASMGVRAVQDTQEDGTNHLIMYIQPSGAPGGAIYRADLQVVCRRTEEINLPQKFACAETVRQSVVLVPGENALTLSRPSRVKEVEAICTYAMPTQRGTDLVMQGTQRTATFLVPDVAYTANPSMAEQQAILQTRGPGGRSIAIDMRHYEVEYIRQS